MSKKEKIYTDTTQDIVRRFYEADGILIEQKAVPIVIKIETNISEYDK